MGDVGTATTVSGVEYCEEEVEGPWNIVSSRLLKDPKEFRANSLWPAIRLIPAKSPIRASRASFRPSSSRAVKSLLSMAASKSCSGVLEFGCFCGVTKPLAGLRFDPRVSSSPSLSSCWSDNAENSCRVRSVSKELTAKFRGQPQKISEIRTQKTWLEENYVCTKPCALSIQKWEIWISCTSLRN
jgi:hypothetical protein